MFKRLIRLVATSGISKSAGLRRIGRKGGRKERARVEFRVIAEDEVRADYRAARTSSLPPPFRKITTARGRKGGGGGLAGAASRQAGNRR